MEPQVFIFIGRSGSGKGTQVDFLRGLFKELDPNRDTYYLSTGEGFRALTANDNFTARNIKAINDVGGLQPPYLAIFVWATSFYNNLKGDQHIFLDGTPRTLIEAQALDTARSFYKWTKPHVMHIEVSEKEVIRRLLERGREDDTADAIKERLAFYVIDVVPAIDYYTHHKEYTYNKINGEQTPEKVFDEIKKVLAL